MRRVAGVEAPPLPGHPPAHDRAGEAMHTPNSPLKDTVSGASLGAPSPAPLHDSLPWACATCGGWVHHLERVYTDEGMFHDRIACLSEDRYEELVAKYACRCEA